MLNLHQGRLTFRNLRTISGFQGGSAPNFVLSVCLNEEMFSMDDSTILANVIIIRHGDSNSKSMLLLPLMNQLVEICLFSNFVESAEYFEIHVSSMVRAKHGDDAASSFQSHIWFSGLSQSICIVGSTLCIRKVDHYWKHTVAGFRFRSHYSSNFKGSP